MHVMRGYVGQFTAAQLAEVYASKRGGRQASLFVKPANSPPLFASGGGTPQQYSEANHFPVLPPLPPGLFPLYVPVAFLRDALPRLAAEITRPFLTRHRSSASRAVRQSDEEVLHHLRRLLWFRNTELERMYALGGEGLQSALDVTLLDVEGGLLRLERRRNRQGGSESGSGNRFDESRDCPPSPTARLPSSIAEQLTWSPTRTAPPPARPKKLPKTYKGVSSSTGDLQKLAIPPTTRTLSGSTFRPTSMFSPTADSSPTMTSALIENEYDLYEVYMSPFRQFFRKKINRQRLCGRNVHHLEDLDGEVLDLKTVLDACVKVLLCPYFFPLAALSVGNDSDMMFVPRMQWMAQDM